MRVTNDVAKIREAGRAAEEGAKGRPQMLRFGKWEVAQREDLGVYEIERAIRHGTLIRGATDLGKPWSP